MASASARHAISVTMTANMNQAIQEFDNVEKKINQLLRTRIRIAQAGGNTDVIDDEIVALRELQAEIARTNNLSQGMAPTRDETLAQINAATQGAGRLQQAFGAAAFGVEDFMSVYGTMGLQGALRASGNNFSQVARILAGPMTGAILGMAAVALPALIKMLQGAKERFFDFAQQSMDQLEQLHTIENFKIRLKFELEDVKVSDAKQGEALIKTFDRNIKTLEQELKQIKEKEMLLTNEIIDTVDSKIKDGLDSYYVMAVQGVDSLVSGDQGVTSLDAAVDGLRAALESGNNLEHELNLLESKFRAGRQAYAADIIGALIEKGKADGVDLKEDTKKLQDFFHSARMKAREISGEIEKQSKARKLLEDRVKKESVDALNAIKQLSETKVEGVLRGYQEELKQVIKLQEAAKKSGNLDTANIKAAAAAAERSVTEGAIKRLKAMLGDANKIAEVLEKGKGLAAFSMKEQVQQAKIIMKEMTATKEEDKEVPRKEVVDAIDKLAGILKNMPNVTFTPVGGP